MVLCNFDPLLSGGNATTVVLLQSFMAIVTMVSSLVVSPAIQKE
jgi:hypothetical protein